jgi:hypothetical protein
MVDGYEYGFIVLRDIKNEGFLPNIRSHSRQKHVNKAKKSGSQLI